MAPYLTPQQDELLRRVAGASGLPATVPRREHCSQDVERLCALGFIAAESTGLSITAQGMAHLRQDQSTGLPASGRSIRVLHGRDQSISVEYRPRQP